MSKELSVSFTRDAHIKHLTTLLKELPKQYSPYSHDILTVTYFIVCGLDMLKALESAPFTKKQIIEWVYSHQLPSSSKYSGFLGGSLLPFSNLNSACHLASTYTALCLLTICGDDLSRVDKRLAASLKDYQNPITGCFCSLPITWREAEEDTRFLYCAFCIAALLNDWSGIDKTKALKYLKSCQNYEGGYGWLEFSESHSGITYCAVSSLGLMGELDCFENKKEIIEFALNRYDGGWNGRIGKIDDTCYSYWNGATLECLGMSIEKTLGSAHTEEFLYSCQREVGGFAKFLFSEHPDILHTFYSLATLSFFTYHLLLNIGILI